MVGIVRIAALCAALVAGPALAQPYPNKLVRIIVPFPAGGPTDVMARFIGQKLSERLGQQFIIENQPGAAGNIGMGNAAKSPGDGYTILFVSSSYVVNPSLYHKVPYDPDKDFVPITKAAAATHALIANPEVPARTVTAAVGGIDKASVWPGLATRVYSCAAPVSNAARASARGLVSNLCGLGRRLTARGSTRLGR